MRDRIPRSVVVADSSDLLAPAVERLRAEGVEVTVMPDGTAAADVADAAADAGAIIDGMMPLGAAEIARLRETRLIVRAGIGYDVIDVAAATERGIWVANVPDYCADEVADHTLLLLLAATRRLDDMAEGWRRAGRWFRYGDLPPVHRPSERVLGIVGMGRIGAHVAARAKPFGWRILGHDAVLSPDVVRERGAEPVELDALFEAADAIALHCPLTDETHHLVNERRLGLTRPGVIIVNTSRGGLVDIDALASALDSGHVSAAGLDVLEDEPDPDLDQTVLHRDNVIVTSHVAWYSIEAKRELAILSADEVLRVLDGRPPKNVVNPQARS